MIRISVIVPIYNAEKHIRRCLDSILSQRLKDIEVICIDDGSTDNSLSIIKQYELKQDNILVFHQENQGAGAARNVGVKLSNGKYICFMDSDDYYPDIDVLRRLYEAAEQENVLICGGNIKVECNGKISTCGQNLFRENRRWKYVDFQEAYYFTRFLYHAQLIKNKGIGFPAYKRFEDPPFLVEAMIQAGEFYAISSTVYMIHRIENKKISYSLETVVYILQGIRDISRMARENGLEKLYFTVLSYMENSHKSSIYQYAYHEGESIWNLVNEIYRNGEAWLKRGRRKITVESVSAYMQEGKRERDTFLEKYHLEEGVIVYGAGITGKYIIEYLEEEDITIIGVAVTKKTSDIYTIGKYEVIEIRELMPYKESALVIIATGTRYWGEITELLANLGFRYVFPLNLEKLEMLQRGRAEAGLGNCNG